jgi:hypothetical protein
MTAVIRIIHRLGALLSLTAVGRAGRVLRIHLSSLRNTSNHLSCPFLILDCTRNSMVLQLCSRKLRGCYVRSRCFAAQRRRTERKLTVRRVAEELQQTSAIAILDAEDRETVMYCLREEAGLLIATKWGRADWWMEQSLMIRGWLFSVGSQRYGAVRYNAGGVMMFLIDGCLACFALPRMRNGTRVSANQKSTRSSNFRMLLECLGCSYESTNVPALSVGKGLRSHRCDVVSLV